MLLDNDVFREFDRMVRHAFTPAAGFERTNPMPMDAWRDADGLHAELELPGVDADSLDLTVERNVLKIRATRPEPSGTNRWLARERVYGSFGRDLFLGEHLDVENLQADFEDGVLKLHVPIAEVAKPRRIEVTRGQASKELTS